MCGIAGLIMPRRRLFDGPEADAIVRTMLSTIQHRGPDGSGLWRDPEGRCVLGQQRLAIIDTSSAGLQPFASGDGRWWITFNGELYNFKELRPQLEQAGIALRGRTDTEVLLESLALWKTDALSRFDGMFAFAAFDTRSGETLLARDPFGEKPLYYMHLPEGGVAFASELQALERIPGFDGTIDVNAVAEVLSFQYIGAPRTIYANVRKLAPGHWMKIAADGTVEIKRYFRFDPGRNLLTGRPLKELADELEDILVRSLDRRMIADVPLGAFLSGGVDSSTTCALVRRRLNRPLQTYSIGFRGAPESEHEVARKFAAHLGTEHYEELLEPESSEFLLGIGSILDEPNADSSCFPTYLLSRFARRHVTVAISGDGGDEMFGGYGRYFATFNENQQSQQGGPDHGPAGDRYYGSRILVASEPQIEELLGFVPDGFAKHVAALRADVSASIPSLLAAMRRTDVENYMPGAVLPKVDRMSMQHSLEVRTPFLNVELARFAERLSDDVLVRQGRGKLILKEIAYRYLPRELVDLPKQGFGLPMSDWAKNSLLSVASELLETQDSRLGQGVGRAGIDRFLARQRSENGFSTYQVWAVAMLESWLRNHPAAKWPALDKFAKASATTKVNSLKAYSAGRNTWIVARKATSLDDAIDGLNNWMLQHFIGTFSEGDESSDQPAADLELPEWSEELTAADRTRLAPLVGAKMIFAEISERDHLGYAAFARLAELGIRRVAVKNPFTAEKIDEVILQGKLHPRLGVRALRLWRRRLASFSNRRLARYGLRSKPLRHFDGNRYATDEIEDVPLFQDIDLSPRYAVFEGTRQLPPLQFAHADIAASGDGRYSIYNRQLFVSSTDPDRSLTRPYWLVPITDEIASDLPFLPARGSYDFAVRDKAKRELEARFRPSDGDGFQLKAGDPVTLLTHALPPGGAERQWVYLAQSLVAAGYKVTFVTYESLEGANGHYLPLLEQSGIETLDASKLNVHRLARRLPHIPYLHQMLDVAPLRETWTLLQIIAALNATKPKAVFAQLDHPNLIAGLAGRLLDIPRIAVSFRNYNPTNFPYLNNSSFLPTYQLLAKSGAIRFTGNHLGSSEDYADWIGIDRSRVVTIPNAVDPEQFPKPLKAEVDQAAASLGICPDDPIVLGIFRLSAEKDPLTFIEVSRRVIANHPNARILIAGVGPMQGAMEQLARDYGIDRNLNFLGRRNDVNVLMTLATVLLLTSAKEGMPNVVVEAQLMATPVVSTDAGATSTIVIEGKTGFIRPIGDADGLALDCSRLLSDRQLASTMGQAGREHAISNFPKAALAERYIAALG